MKSRITAKFRQGFAGLPEQVQQQTREAYRLFKQDPECYTQVREAGD